MTNSKDRELLRAFFDYVEKASQEEVANTLAGLLMSAFIWNDEKQGSAYWGDVYENLINLKLKKGSL